MIVFDTESDGFLDDATKLHVINLIDRTTGERLAFHDHPEVSETNLAGSLEMGVSFLQEAVNVGDVLAGHNIIKHDIPLIKKFFPNFQVHMDQVLDTLVVSRLIWTDLKGMDARAMRKGKRPAAFKEKRLSTI